MKVFLTGATGMVGAHTALALLRAGCELRMLVRDRARAQSWFTAQGYDNLDFYVADMRGQRVVEAGLLGCDAVIHAAAVVNLDPRHKAETLQANLAGVENVVATAVKLGIPKIIYVSSLAVLMNEHVSRITEDGPFGPAGDAYTSAKLACEHRVRDLQRAGAPIVITYPAAVMGPEDPGLSESNAALTLFVNRFVPVTSSGLQIVDVRDLAQSHVMMLKQGFQGEPENWRYIVGGHFVPWSALADVLRRDCGLRLRVLPLPGAALRMGGALMDLARRLVSIEFPLSRESARIATRLVSADSGKLERDFGFSFRDLATTLRDSLTWLAHEGHLTAQHANPSLLHSSNNNHKE